MIAEKTFAVATKDGNDEVEVTIKLDMSEIETYNSEELKMLAGVLAKRLIQYDPSAAARRVYGDLSKLETTDDETGLWLVKNGVWKLNRNWREGDRSAKQAVKWQERVDAAVKKFEAVVERKATDAELEKIRKNTK